MRQPAVVRVRSVRPVALMCRREPDMRIRSARLRLALEFVTLLMLGWSAIYAATLAGSY
jgi:hypothetical protein